MPADFEPGTIGPDAPTDIELQAENGIVTPEHTIELVPGLWRYTIPDTQCVQIVGFSNDAQFVEVERDRLVRGTYSVFDDDVVELNQRCTENHGRVDCLGSSCLVTRI